MLNLVTHDFCGDHGFVRDRDVAGSGRNHRNRSSANLLAIPMEDDRARWISIFNSAQLLSDRSELFSVGACRQDVAPMFGESREKLRHLRGTLPFGKYHFRHSCTQCAMMIELGESQVFEWHVPQALHRFIGRELAAANLFEKFANGISVQKKHSAFSSQHSANANKLLD